MLEYYQGKSADGELLYDETLEMIGINKEE